MVPHETPCDQNHIALVRAWLYLQPNDISYRILMANMVYLSTSAKPHCFWLDGNRDLFMSPDHCQNKKYSKIQANYYQHLLHLWPSAMCYLDIDVSVPSVLVHGSEHCSTWSQHYTQSEMHLTLYFPTHVVNLFISPKQVANMWITVEDYSWCTQIKYISTTSMNCSTLTTVQRPVLYANK